MCEAAARGLAFRCLLKQYRSLQCIELLGTFGYMAAAKVFMRVLGVDVGPVRLPHGNLTTSQSAQLRASLEQAGFLK